MVQRVFEQVVLSKNVGKVVVATDDERILNHVHGFGGEALMTLAAHPSGTDRCAEVAHRFPEAKIVLNVQGDEPFISPLQIDLLAENLLKRPNVPIATLVKKIGDASSLHNPAVVKVVFSPHQEAIYFSRNPIPHVRGVEPELWMQHHDFYKHIGLYGFRREALLEISRLSPTPLEKAESLEQLRWLEHGFRITTIVTELQTMGVDTPEDLESARKTALSRE